MVAAQRVRPDQDDALRRAHVGGLGGVRAGAPAPAHRRRRPRTRASPASPPRRRARASRGRPAKRARSTASGSQRCGVVTVRSRSVSPRRRRTRPEASPARPPPSPPPGPGRRRGGGVTSKASASGSARHQRLAVDLRTAPASSRRRGCPPGARGGRRARTDSISKRRAGGVGRPQEEVAQLRRRLRPRRAQRVGSGSRSPATSGLVIAPGQLAGEFQDLLEVELLAAAEGEPERCRRPRP